MMAPMQNCEAVTSSVSAACSPVSVVAFTLVGLVVDDAADSSPTFTLVGVGIGIVLGGVGFWLRVRSALRG